MSVGIGLDIKHQMGMDGVDIMVVTILHTEWHFDYGKTILYLKKW